MKKRILSCVLALLMVVSIFPAPAFATESTDVTVAPTETRTETTEAATETACPTCGIVGCTSEHLTWCDACKKDDCGVSHVFCEICQTNDCGKNHCPTCGTIDCTTEHKTCEKCGAIDCTTDHTNWCDTCKKDNCGVDHGAAIDATGCEVCGNDPCTCETATEPEQDNCPYCEETTSEDGTVTHAEYCTAAYVYDGTADVNKYLQFIDADSTVYVTDTDNLNKTPDLYFYGSDFEDGTILHIADWYWDSATTALWYQVDFYAGAVLDEWAADWPTNAWVLYDYTDITWDYESGLTFVDTCHICGKPACTTEHVKCVGCNEYDCTDIHFWCDRCNDYDCGKAHLICRACGGVDCEKTHTFCSYCNDYDCGNSHDHKPVTAPVIPENPALTSGTDVSIVDEYGDAVADEFILFEGAKSSLSAWTELEGNVSYQWQVCVDGQWIDIQEQTGKGILASPAMFRNLDSAVIRCVTTSGNQTLTSDEISVSIMEQPEMASFALASNMPSLTETDNSENLQKSYVVVQYVYSDGRTAASTDFAEIIPGNAYSHSYTLPTIPGYKATLNTHSYGSSVTLSGDTLTMNFAANVLTGEYTIFTVTYVPDYVSYTVIHYWQNVDNDNYTEHERETITTTHKTGDVITDAHKSYSGFYNLLYETPAAAADGSTVIEVYYDRYYYLMTFDLGDMGYGVDPIYARYGDTIEVNTPTRTGYTFQGWELNGASADVPATMPAENREYVAQWQAADTAKVSVVFWGENPDDEGYSYIETKELYAKPGISYTFSEEGGLICGYHDHNANCYELTCTLTPHNHVTSGCTLNCVHTAHTIDCYSTTDGFQLDNYHGGTSQDDMDDLGDGLYRYETGLWGLTKHYYVKIGDNWYCSAGEGGNKNRISFSCTHTSHEDECYGCGMRAHAHTDFVGDCYTFICEQSTHTHTSSCYDTLTGLDSDLWKFISSNTVTVDANGTSVVNVYYDRRTFDLTFKVNSTTVKTITDKWGADIHTQFPIVGDNGTDYKGAEWKVPSGCETFEYGTNVLSIDIMPPENIEFTRNSQSDDAKLYYYIEVLSEAECTREYNSRHYQLYKTVYLPNSGRLTESEEFHDIAGFAKGDFYPSGIFSSVEKEMWLYYTRNSYDIQFYNPTDLIKTQENVPYQMPLNSYDWTPTADLAPDKYEPGSVKFGGWYLNPDCTGEQFAFTANIMPAGPNNVNGETALALYAKWEPVEYKVNYYLTKDSLTNGKNIPTEIAELVEAAVAAGAARPATDPYTTVFAEKIVKHGAYIGKPGDPEVAEGYETIHPRAGYDFIGWFYLNEDGEETAFDPVNMPVDRNLNLYGKWSSNVLCYYNVYFALDENADGEADVDTNGNIIYVAAPISGSAIAGRTYTFAAKGGEDLYDPDGEANYQTGYFPTVGSHSIVIDIQDEAGTGANSFTFLYRPKTAVPYTVRYVNKDTGETLFADKVVSDNKNVVVTENFLYKQGYMPDAYQKTLVVTDDGNESNDVIIFYYTEDKDHALYVVNYYIQDLNADLTHKGWTKYTSLQNQGDIGTSYSADAIIIDGFTLSQSYTDDYNVTQKKNGMDGTTLPATVGALTGGKLTGTLTDKGMELNFYYTRNLYPYEFRYMLNGTTTELADPVFGKAGYDSIVTMGAKEIVMDLDGDGINEDYRLYDPNETTKDIHVIKDGNPLTADAVVSEGQATVNVATFYYVRCTQTMTIKKEVVDNSNELDPDPNQEFTIRLLIHATSGYHRSSYAYTKSDGETGLLEPVPSAPNTLQFTLSDGETITIEGLPTAEYTVSELNLPTGYYDTYSPKQRNKLTVDGQLDVVVTNTFEPANLTITKTVDVVEAGNLPEVENFEFTITVPSGVTGAYSYTVGSDTRTETVADGKMTITLQKGQTATFLNLPVGDYIVTESDYSADGYNSNYKVTGDADYTEGCEASVTLERDSTKAVDFMNKFPVGDLVIEKTVTKEFYGTEWNGDVFIFTVERTSKDLIVGNTYKLERDGVASGTATVLDNNTIKVEIPFDQPDAATLNAEGASVTHTLTIKNLPAGTYSVTETEDVAYIQTPSGLIRSDLTLPAEETKAQFTNQLIRKTGNLYLGKVMEVLEGFTPPTEKIKFRFSIELLEGIPTENQTFTVAYTSNQYADGTATATSVIMSDGAFTVELEAGQNVTISGLPEGKYRIIEDTEPYYANSFAHKEDGNWVVQDTQTTSDGKMYTEIDVQANETAQVKCTNTYPVDRAELIIQKLVTKKYDRDTLPGDSFTFTVTLAEEDTSSYPYTIYNADGTEISSDTVSVTDRMFTITLEADQYVVISGMPVCGYTVSENVKTADYIATYKVYVAETGDSVSTTVNTTGVVNDSGTGALVERTFSAGKTDTIVFTNEYKQHLGNLVITKIVNGGSADDIFIFHIKGTDASNSYIDMDVTIKGSGSITIYDLPLGNYSVTEDTSWSWRYSTTASSDTVNLNEDPDATVTFTNTYNEPRWLNYTATMPNVFGKKKSEQEGG